MKEFSLFINKTVNRLASEEPKITTRAAEVKLSQEWNVLVAFMRENREPVTGHTLLRNTIQGRCMVSVGIPCRQSDVKNHELQVIKNGTPADVAPPTPEELAKRPRKVDPLLERLIGALDTQQRQRGFIWAGYVVKTLLPSMGVDAHEAQVLLERLVQEEIVEIERIPNPNNQNFKTSSVTLRHDNDIVRAVLGQNGGTKKTFQPVPVRGEPASATLVRERR